MSSRNSQAKMTPSTLPLRAFMLVDDFDSSITSGPFPTFTINQFRGVFPARAPQIELFAKPCSNFEVVRITSGAEVYEYKLHYVSPTYRIVRVMDEYRQFKKSPSYILAYTDEDAVAGINHYIGAYRATIFRYTDVPCAVSGRGVLL